MAGLPGSGKSTVAEALGAQLRTPVVSVDPLESAILRSGIESDQPTGLAAYLVAETIAESVDAYLEVAEEFRPEGFVNFLRQNPEAHGAALSEIERLQAIMTNARLLGLTEAELIKVKGALARDAMPGNINDRPMFDSLIDPNDTLLLGIR